MDNLTPVEEVLPQKFGIEPTKANELIGDLPMIRHERMPLIEQYKEVIMLDINLPETAKRAGELRKAIAKNRTQGIIPWHKATKEVFLRGGQFVDAVKNAEIRINEAMEEKLELIEKHQELLEKQRKAELRELRMAEIQKYNGAEPIGLVEMDDTQFATYMSGVKYQFEQAEKARIEAEENARIQALHAERYTRLIRYADFIPDIETANYGTISEEEFTKIGVKAKADKDAYDKEQEQLRIKAEQAQKAKEKAEAEALKAQQDADRKAREAQEKAEAEARKAKAEADAKIKAEQEAKAKAEADAKALRDAETARLKAIADAEAKAEADALELAQKSDNDRILAWIDAFQIPSKPDGKYTKKSVATMQLIESKFVAFKEWAKTQAK